ncbi:universal stress protein [Halorussus gelatinilyticus]|uniref:Universal stress protein n=1 Tax=Halorussus gelatinilyticus TaxID=2937524 RepID=A0A8U0IFY7_9EURY|nr:universal stress protein [Halorussus gelatinilyticus]UPV99585.1 universal stress protein [Halorussus gelatinilyticus]
MYDTILVPTDGSDPAERATEHALGLARRFGATVHLITVVDVQSAGGLFNAGGVSEEFVSQLEDSARETLSDAAELADPDDDVRTAVVEGKPAEAILEYADENDADIVFMGTHGRTGIQRYTTGSVTERVVRLSDVPVFTAHVTDRSVVGEGYDDVMIPTDGSDCADVAVDHCLAIAERYDATVHAVNVVNVQAVATGADSWTEEGVDVGSTTDLFDDLEARGESATERVAERAREAGLDAVTDVREGVPASTLLDYADENDVDLITIGTHGRTGIERYFIGSTTAKLVRTSEVPVLSVRAPGDDE